MAYRVYEHRRDRRNPQSPQPQGDWEEATQAMLIEHATMLKNISDQVGLLLHKRGIDPEGNREHVEHDHQSH